MADESKTPESGARESKPPKIKAEDNPWYLLATLYGVPEFEDRKLREKNRIAWNRYFAANLDEEARTKLIEEKPHPAEELAPISPEELQEIQKAFRERCKASVKKPALPASNADIDFSNVEFEFDVSFAGYRFSRWASFDGAIFPGWADFDGAAFSGAFFDRAAFSDSAVFDGAAFSGEAAFYRAAFSAGASFHGAAFSSLAVFDGAAFSRKAAFDGAAFSGEADFGGAAFSGEAAFDGAIFSGHTDFGKATFGGKSSFVNTEMKGETSFEGAIFKTEPPRFFGAKLHQGTVWRGIKWPPKPKDKKEAGAFIDAYACLKLEMDRLKKHDDELDFFALELQSGRAVLGPWRGLPIAIYGALSDYGRSYTRPLVALFVVVAIGAGAFLYFDARTSWEALGLSAANTLNVFGFPRDLGLAIDTPLAWLTAFAATQTILGTILLFLLGLGIRNKFRMK